MKRIITFQSSEEVPNLEKYFRHFKFAIPEHPPIKLSNNRFLHSYRVTSYDTGPYGDEDEEQEVFDQELV